MWRMSDDLLEQIDYWASFIMVNLLWVFCSLPLVTLPAATAGLFAVMARLSQGEAPNVYSTFFEAMRTHWKASTGLVLLNVGVFALICVNLSIFPMMSSFHPIAILSRSVTLFVALLLIMVNGYAWPLLVTREHALRPFAHTGLSNGLCVSAAFRRITAGVVSAVGNQRLFACRCTCPDDLFLCGLCDQCCGGTGPQTGLTSSPAPSPKERGDTPNL